MLDRYTRKLHIIEPQETSLKEFKKEQALVKLQNQRTYQTNKALDDMAAIQRKKEKDHDKYHNHKNKVVSVVNNTISIYELHCMIL